MHTLTNKQAIAITGGLSKPSKMPGSSFGLPTAACRAGFELAKIPGTICADCYATKNFYNMYHATIEPVQHARLAAVELAIASPEYRDAFIRAMATLIGEDEYFRWHDAGDLQSADHLGLIADVARATPDTRHWLPTREPGMVKEFLAAGGTIPDNLIVRISATFPDRPAIIPASLQGIPGIDASHVHKDKSPIARACPAQSQGNACGSCRACWHAGAVSYPAH